MILHCWLLRSHINPHLTNGQFRFYIGWIHPGVQDESLKIFQCFTGRQKRIHIYVIYICPITRSNKTITVWDQDQNLYFLFTVFLILLKNPKSAVSYFLHKHPNAIPFWDVFQCFICQRLARNNHCSFSCFSQQPSHVFTVTTWVQSYRMRLSKWQQGSSVQGILWNIK